MPLPRVERLSAPSDFAVADRQLRLPAQVDPRGGYAVLWAGPDIAAIHAQGEMGKEVAEDLRLNDLSGPTLQMGGTGSAARTTFLAAPNHNPRPEITVALERAGAVVASEGPRVLLPARQELAQWLVPPAGGVLPPLTAVVAAA